MVSNRKYINAYVGTIRPTGYLFWKLDEVNVSLL